MQGVSGSSPLGSIPSDPLRRKGSFLLLRGPLGQEKRIATDRRSLLQQGVLRVRHQWPGRRKVEHGQVGRCLAGDGHQPMGLASGMSTALQHHRGPDIALAAFRGRDQRWAGEISRSHRQGCRGLIRAEPGQGAEAQGIGRGGAAMATAYFQLCSAMSEVWASC